MDPVSLILAIGKLVIDIASIYNGLGEDAEDLLKAVDGISKKVDSAEDIYVSIRIGTLSATPARRDQFTACLEQCKKELEKAKSKGKEIKRSSTSRLKEILRSGDLQRMLANLQERRDVLSGVIQDIQLDATIKMQRDFERLPENLRGRRVHKRDIPSYTPEPVRKRLINREYIDIRDDATGHTALHDACGAAKKDNIELVKLLLVQKANPEFVTDGSKSNSVHLASCNNYVAALEAIKTSVIRTVEVVSDDEGGRMKSMKKVSIMRRYEHDTGRWKDLLRKGNLDWMNALHTAALGVSPEAMEFLVDELSRESLAKSLVNEKDREGRTPLVILAGKYEGNKDAARRVAKALMSAGADPNIADKTGRTATGMLVKLGLIQKRKQTKKDDPQPRNDKRALKQNPSHQGEAKQIQEYEPNQINGRREQEKDHLHQKVVDQKREAEKTKKQNLDTGGFMLLKLFGG